MTCYVLVAGGDGVVVCRVVDGATVGCVAAVVVVTVLGVVTVVGVGVVAG